MIQAAVDRWGRLDIIVNNAYPAMEAMTGGAEDVPPDVYDRAMAVLVKASYLSAKFGVPHLRSAGGGSIVNISSIHGLLVAPGALVYETGKAALIAATRQMAVEYGRDGIRINAIAPGHIVTEGIQAGLWDQNPSGLKFLEAQYPVGRCGRPADIAAAVAFLCSRRRVVYHRPHPRRRRRPLPPNPGKLRRRPSPIHERPPPHPTPLLTTSLIPGFLPTVSWGRGRFRRPRRKSCRGVHRPTVPQPNLP